MYFKAFANPKFDPVVQTIQMKLNAINVHVHGNWPYLQADGLFGEKTKQAVKAFQTYRNITPTSGEVGDTTFHYINEAYNHVPQLSSSKGVSSTTGSNKDLNSILGKLNGFVIKLVFGILKSIQDEFESQAKNLKPFETPRVSSARLQQLVNRSLVGNANIKSLQNVIKDIWKNEDIIKVLAPQAKGNTNAYNYGSRIDSTRLQGISRNQSVLAKSNVLIKNSIKNSENIAKQLYSKCMAEIEKANIAGKIDQMIKKSPKVTKGGSLKGGGVLTVISLIPFISDVIVYFYCLLAGLPSEEAGKKVLKDLIDLLEGAIIGAIVTAVVAAIGLTGGVAIIVVVVVCLIIGLIIALFCPEDTILEWIAKEINKTIHSSVFQEAARTSFV